MQDLNLDLVTVVLPNYNSGQSLKYSIGSVLSQTYENLELIIIDDGSIDVSKDIAKEFEMADPRIKAIYLDRNFGRSYARNIAIKKSIGKYIAFIDAGDIWHNDKLNKQIKFLDGSLAIGVCTSYSWFSSYSDIYNTEKKILIKQGEIYDNDLRFVNPIAMSTAIVERLKIDSCSFEDGYKEDYKFWICILSHNKHKYFEKMGEILTYYHSPTGLDLLFKKVNNAKEQYKIYRLYFKYDIFKSAMYFSLYSFVSVKKYIHVLFCKKYK